MGLRGALWGSVGLHEALWGSVGFCGALWGSVGLCGVLWGSVGLGGPCPSDAGFAAADRAPARGRPLVTHRWNNNSNDNNTGSCLHKAHGLQSIYRMLITNYDQRDEGSQVQHVCHQAQSQTVPKPQVPPGFPPAAPGDTSQLVLGDELGQSRQWGNDPEKGKGKLRLPRNGFLHRHEHHAGSESQGRAGDTQVPAGAAVRIGAACVPQRGQPARGRVPRFGVSSCERTQCLRKAGIGASPPCKPREKCCRSRKPELVLKAPSPPNSEGSLIPSPSLRAVSSSAQNEGAAAASGAAGGQSWWPRPAGTEPLSRLGARS